MPQHLVRYLNVGGVTIFHISCGCHLHTTASDLRYQVKCWVDPDIDYPSFNVFTQ